MPDQVRHDECLASIRASTVPILEKVAAAAAARPHAAGRDRRPYDAVGHPPTTRSCPRRGPRRWCNGWSRTGEGFKAWPETPGAASYVEISDVERILLDELAARLDDVAHQPGEDLVGNVGLGDLDPQQGAVVRV